MGTPRICLLLILPLLALSSPGRVMAHHRAHQTTPCPACAVSPFVSSIGALSSTVPEGAFHALMGQVMAAGESTKIVFRITGHGPLTITAVGPDDRSIPPDWIEAHGGGSTLEGVVPGDEWGSGWTFPAAGCWHLHAVRADIVSDIYFEVAVPQLVGMTFTIASPRQKPIRSGQRIVFSLDSDVQPGALETLKGTIAIRHAGKTYRVLRLQGDINAPLRPSLRLRVALSMWFTAVAHLSFRHNTLSRTLRLKVNSARATRW